MNTVYLGLGSNMGDRVENLRRAIAELHPDVQVSKKSKLYESQPMYVRDQPLFYNMVVSAQTDLAPTELLHHAKSIEERLGRQLDTHNQPRPIDIDILLYDEHVLDTPDLTIPHPRMHERAFVMVPLTEIAPFYVHPILRKPIVDLADEIGEQSVGLIELNISI